LPDNTNANTWVLINNDNALDLSGAGTSNFIAYNSVSRTPDSQIAAYRLVSAGVIVTSASANVRRSGIVKGGLFTRTDQQPHYLVDPNVGHNPFGGNAGISGVIDQAMYCQTADLSSGHSFRAVYMPFDPSFEFFVELNRSRADLLSQNCDDFFWNFYITGDGNQSIRMEIYWNWEFEPKQESFTQGMVNKSTESTAHKEQALEIMGSNDALITQSLANAGALETAVERFDESFLDRTMSFLETGSKYVGKAYEIGSMLAPFIGSAF